MITVSDIAEVFEQVADRIITCGWRTASLGKADTAQCLDGHLMTVCDLQPMVQNPLYYAARLALRDYIKRVTPTPTSGSIWCFNDLRIADAGEARDHLLLAAKDLRNDA